MTHIELTQSDISDERWLHAGADAFALWCAAMAYSDQQLLDGRISQAMAARVSLAVPPERVGAALAALVEYGFLSIDGADFVIENYHEHALPADQIRSTRAGWKQDKDRRRLHGIGNHSLCKDPKYCPAVGKVDSTGGMVESGGASTGGTREHGYSTGGTAKVPPVDSIGGGTRSLPHPTPPHPTPIGGGGWGAADAARRSAAAAPPADTADAHRFEDDGSGITCQVCEFPRTNARHIEPEAMSS
jgi:hypothetical protein